MPRKPRILLAGTAILAVACGGAWWSQRQAPPASAKPVSSNNQSPIINLQSLPLHPVVNKIVKEGPEMPYLKLNYVIKELPTNLAPHDIDALITFIMAPRPAAFQDGEWGSLTNDIQEALSVQTVPSQKVCQALIATYRDETRIQMMRDYALQHVGGFAIYLVHTRDTRGGTLPPFFNDLVAELKSATSDPSKPWAGTAFNMLDGLLRAAESRGAEVAGVSADELTRMAIPVAANPQAPLNARLPALQLASRRKAPEALQQARAILADTKAGIMLIQSAAAVLGEQGGKDDLALLEKLRAGNRPHIQVAVNAAIRRLSQP